MKFNMKKYIKFKYLNLIDFKLFPLYLSIIDKIIWKILNSEIVNKLAGWTQGSEDF